VFPLYGRKNETIASVNLKRLKEELLRIKKVSDFAAIDGKLDTLVNQLEEATNQ
jgi:hypothetical protein